MQNKSSDLLCTFFLLFVIMILMKFMEAAGEGRGVKNMKVYVRVKALGKRRPVLDNVPREIPENLSSLREFLTEIVRMEVEQYNRKGEDVQVVSFLTNEEVAEQATAGKVGFGRIYSDRKADVSKAVMNAIQCYKDGLVRVFKNEDELTALDEPLIIQEDDCFTFIRLTFLAGRMW